MIRVPGQQEFLSLCSTNKIGDDQEIAGVSSGGDYAELEIELLLHIGEEDLREPFRARFAASTTR